MSREADPDGRHGTGRSGVLTKLGRHAHGPAAESGQAAQAADHFPPPVAEAGCGPGELFSSVPDPSAAAFFDVDNTLLRGASIYHFARGLAARKLFGPTDLARITLSQIAFRLRGFEDPSHIDAAREAALAFVAGHRVDDIVTLGEEIYDDTIADRIWAGTRDLTRRHLLAGQRVYLVTATPVELATILARRLGLTGALGTVAETDDGVYTGRLVGGLLHGPAKATAIVSLADREGLDLSKCSAYSDSANDLPMLELVGHPNVVNPDGELLRAARSRGWPVYEFRSARRATLVALPVAAGAGAVAGGMAAGLAIRRRRTSG
jgi:HAD superfamily hydrolase (TIGR01490 family)